MQLKTLVLGAALAASAAAESGKPRFYFPRNVKRQFTNATITSHATFPAPESTPLESRDDTTPSFFTSLRQHASELLPGGSRNSASSLASEEQIQDDGTILVSTSDIPTSASVELAEPTSSDDASSGGLLPPINLFPSDSDEPTTTEEPSAPAETDSASDSDGGLLPPINLLPTDNEETTTTTADAATTSAAESDADDSGLLPPINLLPTESDNPTTTEESSAPAESTDSASDSDGGLLPPINLLPTASEETTATTDAATQPTPTSDSTDSLPPPVDASQPASDEATTVIEETATEPTATASSGTGTGGLLPPIELFPTESEEATTSTAIQAPVTSSSSTGIVIAPTGIVTSDAAVEPSSEAAVDTDSAADSASATEVPDTSSASDGGLLDPIVSPVASIVTDLLPPLPTNGTDSEEPANSSAEPPESTQAVPVDPASTDVPVPSPTTSDGLGLTDILPIPTSLPIDLNPPVSTNSSGSELPGETLAPPSETPITSTGLPIPPEETSAPPEDVPLPPNSTTDSIVPSETGTPIVPSSDAGDSLPSDSIIETSSLPDLTSAPTELPGTTSPPSNTSDVDVEPTPTPAPSTSVPVTTPTEAPPTPSSVQPPLTSVEATNTITGTDSWMPTTIIVQPSPTTTASGSSTTTTVQVMPSDLPGVITPGGSSDTTQPEGTVLLQVGFLYAENYEFVSNTPMAAAQIFSYLPQALADAANVDSDKIRVTRLVPFDTMQTLGYITTLARFYYPESMVDQLAMDVKIPNSNLYNHPQELIANLTANINPAIDIFPGNEHVSGSSGDDSSDGGSSDSGGDMFDNNEGSSSPIQQGTAAAIGIGAVGVAAAYGAAMFLIARRYKQKKQAHRRASSITNSSEMRYTGAGSPAMMGGALMSREFSSYGGVAGGRDSHGSGRSGAGNSARTAQISAPVAAENSLGWN